MNEMPCRLFGWKFVQPQWLQFLNNAKCFVLFMAIFSTTQGMIVNGVSSAVLPTIEKEFGLSSTEAGIILACNDAAGLMSVLLASYFGGKGHRPRWLGLGALLTGIGSLVYALPKLMIGRYEPSSMKLSRHDLCYSGNPVSGLACASTKIKAQGLYMFVFCLGQLIMGAGTAPLYTLGPSFIDDNVDPQTSPLYIGIWFAATLLGPGLGILFGSSVQRVYVDITQPAGSSLTPEDPRWLGAWWLGYFAFSWVLMLVGAVICGYPRELPGAREKIERAIANGELKGKIKTEKKGILAMLSATLRLLKNKSLVFMIFGQTARTIQGVGIGSFVVKLLVVRFGASFFVAGISTGLVVMPAMTIGIMTGSFIMKRAKIKDCGSRAIKVCVLMSIISSIASLNALIPGCENTKLAGVMVPYHNGSKDLGNITHSCNSGCNCRRDNYSPVCGSDGLTYFSSCYAGCLDKKKKELYKNCSCVKLNETLFGGTAKSGRCDRHCKNLAYYLLAVGATIIIGFVGGTPQNMGIMRIVAEDDKSHALGIQFLVMRSLSFLPAPMITGAILDQACLLWRKDLCGNRLECLEYHLHDIIVSIVIFGVTCSVVGAILYALAWYFYIPLHTNFNNNSLKVESSLTREAKNVTNTNAEREKCEMAFDNLALENMTEQ